MAERRRFDIKRQHYAGEEGALIPLLQQAQAVDGFISRTRIEEIHARCGIPLAQIYGVATFYAQFRLHPIGKHLVRVCHGTACHLAGADRVAKVIQETLGIGSGETSTDGLFTVETVSCLGCCSLAPVIMIGDTTHGNLTEKAVKKAIRQSRSAAAGKAQ